MKFYILTLLGVFISIFGLFRFAQYAFRFEELSEYGRGFVAGNAIMVLIGAVLIYIGYSKLKES